MALGETDCHLYLRATPFLDKDNHAIRDLAARLRRDSLTATAMAAFDWVRDEVRFDPRNAVDPEELYMASAVLGRGSGYCVQKAALLAAVARAAEIPARLGFADVRNHKTPAWLQKMMGSNVFAFHGCVELYLDGRWRKATPAFDQGAADRADAVLVEFDGQHDAMLHPADRLGQPHFEYVRDRGSYAEVPVAEIQRTFREMYRR